MASSCSITPLLTTAASRNSAVGKDSFTNDWNLHTCNTRKNRRVIEWNFEIGFDIRRDRETVSIDDVEAVGRH